MRSALKTLQALATADDQDFTVFGFGAPELVLIFAHADGSTVDAEYNNWVHSFAGFVPGQGAPNVYCQSRSVENGVSTGNENRWEEFRSGYAVYINQRNGATNDYRTATIATTTNGVTLTWAEAAGPRPQITVVLIKDINGAQVGYFNEPTSSGGTVNVTTTGINPNCIFFSACGATLNTDNNAGDMAFGVATKDGEHCQWDRHVGSVDPQTCRAYFWNNCSGFWDGVNASTDFAKTTVSTWGTGSFTVQSNWSGSYSGSGGTNEMMYVAFEDVTDPELDFCAARTTAGDWTPFTASFEPNLVYITGTRPTAQNQYHTNSGQDTRNQYWISNSTSSEDEVGWSGNDENNTTGTNTSGRWSRGLVVTQNTGTLLFSANSGGTPSDVFTSSGLTFASANVSPASEAHPMAAVSFAPSGPTITDFGDEAHTWGESGLIITGTNFGT